MKMEDLHLKAGERSRASSSGRQTRCSLENDGKDLNEQTQKICICRFVIRSSQRVIDVDHCCEFSSLIEPICESDGHRKMIYGLHHCTFLCRTEIPSSVEIIGALRFWKCTSVKEGHFKPNSRLIEFRGFGKCISLCRFTIPPSVTLIACCGRFECIPLTDVDFEFPPQKRRWISQVIYEHGFSGCRSLIEIICRSHSQIISHRCVSSEFLHQLKSSPIAVCQDVSRWAKSFSLSIVFSNRSSDLIDAFRFVEFQFLKQFRSSITHFAAANR
jgi:hypothetical protein